MFLVQVSARVPDFTPARVLDFGSGVGSAFWAIEAVWPRAVKEAVAVETSQSMQELANALRAQVRSSPSGCRPNGRCFSSPNGLGNAKGGL